MPVTSKAQNSAEYQEYLSRIGEDNDLHYDIKLQAAQLLMDNVEHTFVTPVFNGSASLRNAAGQMIEEVTKSIRRNQTVDDDYIVELYGEMNSLYRLDQTSASSSAKDLGPLPSGAVVLIAAIVICWFGIILYTVITHVKTKNKRI